MKGPKYISSNFSEVYMHEQNYKAHLKNLNTIKQRKTKPKSDHMVMLDDMNKFKAQRFRFNELKSNLINTRNNRVLLDHLINITNRENEYAKTVSPHRTSVQQPSAQSHNKRNYFRKLEQDRIAHENEIIARKLMKQEARSGAKEQIQEHIREYRHHLNRLQKLSISIDQKVVVKDVEANRSILKKKLPPLSRDSSLDYSITRKANQLKALSQDDTMKDSRSEQSSPNRSRLITTNGSSSGANISHLLGKKGEQGGQRTSSVQEMKDRDKAKLENILEDL